ncbi:MAG TPA: undecaprenyldiphospho-muramoylpentapeptide beta-N-acetylglucosaminyltransferase [Candidatus Hydrogenedentes bacterium]|nr:undecaprenyldiphospho-muramoylpentapeptide beta-N-acetylglucosaminyltransferase [Candidatus Hydrogenedentota bacterium]HPG68085.1 undecaprenyldiphospho-muramoylpentapeptide beta-N-acetylglucosaminyltransferase [Candidatus Hydrogenedentota bacterium]
MMITGGGTGGHTSPAIAIIEELRKRDPLLMLQWVGRKGNLEERVSRAMDIPFRSVPVEGWPRGQRWRKAWAAAKLAIGMARAAMFIRGFRPQVVLGVGGYVSLPLMYAAQRMGVATVVHEQNKRLGLANRLLAQRARRILLSYPDTLGDYPQDRARVVGNPVRAGFASPPSQAEAKARLGLAEDAPVVLVCGGSQGAHTLNVATAELLGRCTRGEIQFLWMTGAAEAEAAREHADKSGLPVQVFPFIDDMVTACAAADLVVSRAGASTTAELAVLGKPSVLVPYPFATDNHQEQNARALEAAGAAAVILDDACSGERLAQEIRSILGSPERLAAMAHAAATLARPSATETIAEEILSLVFESAQ